MYHHRSVLFSKQMEAIRGKDGMTRYSRSVKIFSLSLSSSNLGSLAGHAVSSSKLLSAAIYIFAPPSHSHLTLETPFPRIS